MEFLEADKIKSLLTESKVSKSDQILTPDQVALIKGKIELIPSSELAKGNCLANAYTVAKNIGGEVIEGVAHVFAKDKEGHESETIIKHAWNKLNGIEFDVTKDYVWPNGRIDLMDIFYNSVKKYNVNDYVLSGSVIEFKSNVELITSSLKYLHTKKMVLTALNYLGLEQEAYEQLLNDCILTIRKKD